MCWWGGGAFLSVTRDSGATWSTIQTAPKGIFSVSAIACPRSNLDCFAATSLGVIRISPDLEPQLESPLDYRYSEDLADIACIGRRCVAVGMNSTDPLVLVRPATD
jgi:hypothetical protein